MLPRMQMAVIGYDAYGRPYVGQAAAPRPVGTPSLFHPPAPVQMTPAQAAQVLAQQGISVPPTLQNYLPLAAPGGPAPVPDWRSGQIAPGVETPQEGMVPLPLTAQTNNGIFTGPGGTPANVAQIIFQGQLQKPYRAERLLVQTAKVGTSAAVTFVQAQIFVGTDLQEGDILPINLELLGASNAFGTRLTLQQAPPGVLIRLITTLTSPLTTTDTVAVNMMFLGRIIH